MCWCHEASKDERRSHMKFSIITINYNESEGLGNTIASVEAQTCHDYEYIIIDGGSTDESVDVIKQHTAVIDYWVSEKDNGIYNAMNKGIVAARGDYCIFMNSGDVFYNAEVLEHVSKAGIRADVVCGDICFGHNNICPNPSRVTMKTFYKHTLYHQASFICTALLKAHPYDEALRSAADWKWFLHTLIFHNATYAHIPVTIARFEGGGFSEKQHTVGQKEVDDELHRCLPVRVLEDYEDYCVGLTPFRRMMNGVENVPVLLQIIFPINKLILKILNLKLKSEWIKRI